MNIDKDIEILKDIKEHYVMLRENGTGIHPQYERTISNVLTQLNANKYDINNYEERITSLKSELETYKKIVDEKNKELNEENLRCSFYAIENNDLKEKLEIQGNITETYKKIAEKLAEYIAEKSNFCANKCCMNEECHDNDCIIDWARKEVDKDE